ncbi:EpsG family protein [Eubacteriales bacterium mix99]|jgi:hypothetical protein
MTKLLLLILVLIVAPAMAAMAQKERVPIVKDGAVTQYIYNKFSLNTYSLSFVILFLIVFITKSGEDIPTYVQYYKLWSLNDLKSLDFEPGYKLLCIFLNSFISNPYIGIGIIKFFSLFLVYRAIYLLRDRINVGFSVFAYVTLLYIYSFHLLRMMLALSIVFLAYSYESMGKEKRCFLLLCIALLFHYSAIFALGAYLIYKFINSNLTILKIISLLVVGSIALFSFNKFAEYAITKFSIFSKYDAYLKLEGGSGSGIMQIIWLLPILYIIMRMYHTERFDKFYVLSVVCGIFTFYCGSLGYFAPVFSRSAYYFYFFFVMYCASLQLKPRSVQLVYGSKKVSFLTLFMIVYLIVRLFFNIHYDNILVSNGLDEYILFWD